MENANKVPDFNALVQHILSQAPRYAAVEAAKFFTDNFVRGGFQDRAVMLWAKPTSPLAGKKPLYSTGNLMRSVRGHVLGKMSASVVSDTACSELHNNGGTITVTEQSKRYWWAMYYKHAGKLKKTKKGRMFQAADNRKTNRKAEFCRAMALMRVGSKIKIPARPFIGESYTLMHNLDAWVAAQIQQRCNDI